MLKKRLIFALLWQNDAFWLSRNFRIQKAGNLAWIEKNYNFGVIADAIDELVVLNVSRGDKSIAAFSRQITELTRGCFVPLAAGGGIRSVDDATALLRSGADKLIVNTPLFTDAGLIRDLVLTFGSQCVVASIDYKRVGESTEVFSHNGSQVTGMTVHAAVDHAVALGVGEVLVTSMDRDGTGQGYDTSTLDAVAAQCPVPVIASGGVGNFDHLAEWFERPRTQAACTANIFNFLGNGLLEARRHVVERGTALATWEFGWRG